MAVRYLMIANLAQGDKVWWAGERVRVDTKNNIGGKWYVRAHLVTAPHHSVDILDQPLHGKIASAYPGDDKPAEF